MVNHTQYEAVRPIQIHNQEEAKRRITKKFGGIPPNCEDKTGKPICKFYEMCKQVKTYEPGVIPEPLCALPDDEIAEFILPISWKIANIGR